MSFNSETYFIYLEKKKNTKTKKKKMYQCCTFSSNPLEMEIWTKNIYFYLMASGGCVGTCAYVIELLSGVWNILF